MSCQTSVDLLCDGDSRRLQNEQPPATSGHRHHGLHHGDDVRRISELEDFCKQQDALLINAAFVIKDLRGILPGKTSMVT